RACKDYARRKTAPDALDLVRRYPDGEMKSVVTISATHYLHVLVKPVQPLSVCRIKFQFDQGTVASQPNLDGVQETIDPLSRQSRDRKPGGLPRAPLLREHR